MGKYRLRIKVEEIEGDCHVHEEGEEFLVESDGQTIRPVGTEKICLYALNGVSSVLPAMTKELSEDDWMAKEERLLQCMDPGPEREGSGTAYLKIKRERVDSVEGE